MAKAACRHIVSLSGGKDSTALAIYMRDRLPSVEYVFCDTNVELSETYEYLDRLEVYLGQRIVRLNPDRDFEHYRQIYCGVLPDARTRWCTRMLKLKPFERYIGNDPVISYVGIRADEDREGYISHRPNITPRFPFKEDGITHADVMRILEESGLGLPRYYEWRSRSGCYFCFFQRRVEWVGLLENHPELFQRAMAYEKVDDATGVRFTWCERESLAELSRPERVAEIKEEFARQQEMMRGCQPKRLAEVFASAEYDDDDDGARPCLVCTL